MSKKTKQKETILRVLNNTASHPTAQWIYGEVRKDIPNVSLGTIYRNLNLLKQEGKIMKLDLADNLTRFDGLTRVHSHFRCEECGGIFDVDQGLKKDVLKRMSEKTGYKVLSYVLEFRGLCQHCQ